MITMIIIFVLFAAVAAALFLVNRLALGKWMHSPLPPGHLVMNGNGRWYVTVKGKGRFAVVIESRLGGPSPEWWPIQDALAGYARVVSYDRAGYGWSDPPVKSRTSIEVARELHAVLQSANVPGPYILVGHSQGGLYVQHFARLFSDEVAGCVFLDPLSTQDDRFARELDPRVYRGSGVDKRPAIRMTATLCKLGLLPLFKPLLIKSPPFYYYKNLPQVVMEIIWRHHLRPELYSTSLAEYEETHQPANTQQLMEHEFPNIPVAVLYHNAEIIIEEIIKYGGLSREEAQQVESLWENLTRSYLELAVNSKWIVAEDSSHFIPLDQPELVVSAIKEMLMALDH